MKKMYIIYAAIAVLIIILCCNKSVSETFESSTINVDEMNNVMGNQIMNCESNENCEKIKQLVEFRKLLKYPSFHIGLYGKLYKIRETRLITLNDIITIMENAPKGRYDMSFQKRNIVENMSNDEIKEGCQDSMDNILSLRDIALQQNEDNFSVDVAAWQERKKSLINELKYDTSGQKWREFCTLYKTDCESKYDDFFLMRDGEQSGWHHAYIQFPSNNRSEAKCALACIEDDQCDFFTYRPDNGQCWLKGFDKKINTENDMIYKTDEGKMRIRTDRWLDGNDIDNDPLKRVNTAQACANECKNNPACHFAEYKKTRNECWLSEMVENKTSRRGGTKNLHLVSSFNLSDRHKWVTDAIGFKPDRSDLEYNNPITLPAFQCQICIQEFNRVVAENNVNPNFDQVQTCVSNLSTGESPSPPSNTSPPPSTPPSIPSSPPSAPPSDDKDNTNLWLGLGGGGVVLLLISSVVAAIIIVMLVM
jgi:PAN domain